MSIKVSFQFDIHWRQQSALLFVSFWGGKRVVLINISTDRRDYYHMSDQIRGKQYCAYQTVSAHPINTLHGPRTPPHCTRGWQI